MPELSVVVLTKNEEGNIRECLERVTWADEIVIIDDDSEDRTLEIAREFTDKIYKHTMEGFGPQRNFGIDKAKGEWIYFVDADDRVTPELKDEILETIKNPSFDAFMIYQKSSYLGKWIFNCGWYAPAMKLMRRNMAKFSSDKAVEKPLVQGELGCLKSPVLHLGYPDLSTHIRKISLYSQYEAEQIIKKGINIRWHNMWWYFILKPFAKFAQKYVYLKGYREGVHGFVLSGMNAFYVFLIYCVIWEKKKQ
jgi:glycosyltransferase involved in cell wall biosynthesis